MRTSQSVLRSKFNLTCCRPPCTVVSFLLAAFLFLLLFFLFFDIVSVLRMRKDVNLSALLRVHLCDHVVDVLLIHHVAQLGHCPPEFLNINFCAI